MIVSDWIWDEETYPNCFLFAITRADGQFTQVFECSDRRNDISRIIACFRYMKENNQTMFGFNSLGFDYPIAHDTFLKNPERYEKMSGALIAKALYEAAQNQIESMRGRFPKTIPERDHQAPQADLYKIWHFDNAAKATGLKMIEFNMRAHNIEDLPYAVGTYLTHEEMDNLRKYNLHDVEMTRQFYLKSQAQISLRRELTKKYGRNFLNHNDTKIGKDYFIMRLEEAGIATKNGAGEVRQTIRDEIIIKDCLFNYYDFQYPEFIAVVDWLKRQEITETKGVFSDITEEDLGDVAQYAELTVKKQKLKTKEDVEKFKRTRKLGWIEEKELKATEDLLDADGNPVMYYPNGKDGKPDMTKKPKKVKVPKKSYYGCWHIATNLNVVINGFRFDFGTGGIHGSISNKIARANHKYQIVDADV